MVLNIIYTKGANMKKQQKQKTELPPKRDTLNETAVPLWDRTHTITCTEYMRGKWYARRLNRGFEMLGGE
jgi:hypothetical protein